MVKLIGIPAAGLNSSLASVFVLASVFALGEDTQGAIAMYQLPQVIPNGGWGQWINRGTPPGVRLVGELAVSLNNFIDLSALNPVVGGRDSRLYALPQHDGGGQWTSLGGIGGAPALLAVGTDASTGVQAVFAAGTGQLLSFRDQYGVDGWTLHPGPRLWTVSPAVAQSVTNDPNPQGRYQVFAVGQDKALWHIFQTAPGNGYPLTWLSFGQPPGTTGASNSPAVAPSQDGRLEVFVTAGGALWHFWQHSLSDFSWSDWYSHGSPPRQGVVNKPVLAMNAFGKLELFIVAADGALWEIYQTARSNGWSAFYSHGKPPGLANMSDPTITSSQDGRLELFVIGGTDLRGGYNGALWHKWQLQNIDDPTIHNWSSWYSHGTP